MAARNDAFVKPCFELLRKKSSYPLISEGRRICQLNLLTVSLPPGEFFCQTEKISLFFWNFLPFVHCHDILSLHFYTFSRLQGEKKTYSGGNNKMLQKYAQDLKKEFAGYNAKGLLSDVMAGLTVAACPWPWPSASAAALRRPPACLLPSWPVPSSPFWAELFTRSPAPQGPWPPSSPPLWPSMA